MKTYKGFLNWWPNRFEESFVLSYGTALISYLKHKEIHSMLILYEDIVENPAKVAKGMFDLMGVDEVFVGVAVDALESDSQNEMFGARGEFRVSEEDLDKFDRVLIDIGLMEVHRRMSLKQFKAFLSN